MTDTPKPLSREQAVEMLRRGPEGVSEWKAYRKAGGEVPSLDNVELRELNLIGVNLAGVYLEGSNFLGSGLIAANLSGAILRNADLRRTDLSWASLNGADLTGADFTQALLRDTSFSRSDLNEAKLGYTVLEAVDLTSFCLVDSLQHVFPSCVDWRAIARSLRSPGLETFLMNTGMPEAVVAYLVDSVKTIDPLDLFAMMQSTFISYGGNDGSFAAKLHEVLQRNGVPTWCFHKDANRHVGTKLHRFEREQINHADRVILVCSKTSLNRPGVLSEIELTLDREQREGGREILLPIRLDNYVMRDWKPERPDLAQAIRDRIVADFRGARSNPAKFDAGILDLLKALRKPSR